MVALGRIQKQQTGYFGRQGRTSYLFNRVKSTLALSPQFPILPPVDPQEHPLLPHAYTFLKASYGDIDAVKKMITLGYTQDTELSNVETNTYVKEGKPLILHRGSSNAIDFLISDLFLVVNLSHNDPRVWSAKKITKRAEEKYKRVADHCGHSLGGFLSEICASPLSYVLTYNKGASYYHVAKSISPRQLDIRTKGDLVSLLSKFQNKNSITVDNKGSGFLGAHNLNNLD
jgi:hypothetical protein